VDYNLGLKSGLEAVQKIKSTGFKIVALASGDNSRIHPRIPQIKKISRIHSTTHSF